ncbi:response regulator transcription factor [Prolixibacteraceae bacterium JC049]|nr:response regulator transcription factor [Prolixibacteraceae bacterium JC049]
MYNCLIVDDEPIARTVISTHLEKLNEFNIVNEVGDALSALEELRNKKIDLIFLDINMPQLSGLELVRLIKDKEVRVIFTTAYRDYAVEAFELDVVDYLVKPISFERFLKAVEKFVSIAKKEQAVSDNEENEFIFVKENKKLHRVKLEDILFIESMGDYITINLTDKQLVVKDSLKNYEGLLPRERFARVHRGYIIAIAKVDVIDGNLLEIGSKKIPVGRNYRDILQLFCS